MCTLWQKAVFGTLIAALSVVSASAERRVALVIGNSAYLNVPILPNPNRDASAVADLLRKASFDVVTLKADLGSLQLKREIRDFFGTARDSDVAVVYFAGHGIEVNGTNYLIPTDAKLVSDFDVDDEGVGLDRILRVVEPARRLRLIIVDACRDNPFGRKMKRAISSRGLAKGLATVEPETSNTLVAFAAKAGSTAEDGTGDHSPFTTALLKHLTVPGLDLRLVFGRVRDDVLKNTGGKQEPFVYGSLGGNVAALIPEPVVPPTPHAPTIVASDDYKLAERIGTREGWEAFLRRHTSGFHVDLARAQLSRLQIQSETAAPRVAAKTDQSPAGELEALSPTSPANACSREQLELVRLRTFPSESNFVKLERELTCEQLRPQLNRLRESIFGIAPKLTSPTRINPTSASPSVKGAAAIPGPINPPTMENTASPPKLEQSACKREEDALARLRVSRIVDDVMRLDRELVCETLRPQVHRLLQSMD